MDMTKNRTYESFTQWGMARDGFHVVPPANDPKAQRGTGRDYPPDDARCVAATMLVGEDDDRVKRFVAHRMEREMARMPFRDPAEVERFVTTCLEEVNVLIRCVEGKTDNDWDPASAFAG